MRLYPEDQHAITDALAQVRAAVNQAQNLVDNATVITDPTPPDDGGGTPPPSPAPGPPDRPYSPAAPWNQPVTAAAVTDANSAAITRALAAKATDKQVHLVPYTAVNIGHDRTYQAVIGGRSVAFRGPAVLRRGDSPDYGMVVVDDQALTAARFYQPSIPSAAGVITAAGAGLFDVSAGNATGRATSGGGTGWGLSSDVGIITVGDVERGRVDHALRLHLNGDLLSGRVRAPAIKTDPAPAGGWIGSVDYGTRFQLDPSLDYRDFQPAVWPEGWKAMHRVIFQGLQTYGAMHTDRTGTGLVLAVESNPRWGEVIGAPDATSGNYSPIIRGGRIPWSALRVIAV